MNATVERVRAVLRLLGNDEITPTGRRMIEKVLDAEVGTGRSPMRTGGTRRYVESGEYEGEYEKD